MCVRSSEWVLAAILGAILGAVLLTTRLAPPVVGCGLMVLQGIGLYAKASRLRSLRLTTPARGPTFYGAMIGAQDTITYRYDLSGRRTEQRHADGRRREYAWSGMWQLTAVTDHESDQVRRTTTVVDALGQLARVDNQELFFNAIEGGLLQAGEESIVSAGPLTAHASQGWLEPSWRPDRDTTPMNPYLPPVVQASLGGGLGLGSRGEVQIAGMEWLGARVFDPGSHGFLTPDPLPPITGAGWARNPYSYAGNNPANLYDPSGLRPITAEELDAYRKANSPKWGTALAIVAGIGLAFVPGAQGFAAALIAGAVLGGGASIIDQACSGYPIDWKKVGVDTLLGAAGGAAGWGVGKGIQWAAKTPAGQAVIGWTARKANEIPVLRDVMQRLAPKGEPPTPDLVDLASAQRRTHILDGDGTGGGHRWPGLPGKTPFPRDWSDDQIMHAASETATSALEPASQTGPAGALFTNAGNPARLTYLTSYNEVSLKVVAEPMGEGIITAYPTVWPELKFTPAEIAARNELAFAGSQYGEQHLSNP